MLAKIGSACYSVHKYYRKKLSALPVVPVVPVPAIVLGAIVRRFVKAGALDEANAKTLDDLGFRKRFRPDLTWSPIFKRLVRKGYIKEAGGGRYYMAQAYYDKRTRIRKRIPFIVLPLGIVLLVLGLLLARYA